MSKKNRRIVLTPVVEEQIEKVVESTPIVIDPEVFTTKLFVEEPEISLEELVAQEEYINELPEESFEVEPPVEEIAPVMVDPISVKFEFQDEYHLTHDGNDAIIDTLPEPVMKAPRTIDGLNSSELREFRRTGRMPK